MSVVDDLVKKSQTLRRQRDEARAERDALAARLRGVQIYADENIDCDLTHFCDICVHLQQISDMASGALDGENA